MTMSVVGFYLLGALGAWRLVTVFPESRARIAGMVVYVATPLVPGLMSQGDWGALLWYAALPWLLHLVRRGAGLETADPSTTGIDLVDGVAPVGLRRRARAIAFAALVLALTAAFVPVAIALFLASVLVVALATLLVGGSWRVAGWMTVCAVLAAGAGARAQPAVGAGVDVGRRHRRPPSRRQRTLDGRVGDARP